MTLTGRPAIQQATGWTEIEDDPDDVAIRDSALQLRDSRFNKEPDAAVLQGISLAGFENIWLDFDWAASCNTESFDDLYVSWDLNDDSWTNIWSHQLGGSGFASVSLDFLGAVDDEANFRLAFWTDVNSRSEAAYIDNVVLRGDEMGGEMGGAPVPEPATMFLLGSGLLGLVGLGRKKFFKK